MPLNWPIAVTTNEDRYRYAYAAVEAIRLKHNTRAGDLTAAAAYFRRECLETNFKVVYPILDLRPKIITPGWVASEEISIDPLLTTLKADGKADWKAADVKELTGIDLDALSGAAPAPPDPTEDFTGYTELDDYTYITLTASKLDIDSMQDWYDTWVYYDYGAAHFGATWEHFFDLTPQAENQGSGVAAAWAVSNIVDSVFDWAGNTNEALGLRLISSASLTFHAFNWELAEYDAFALDPGMGTTYYCTAERASETLLEIRFYSDAPRTSLTEMADVSITNGRRYRYVFGCVSNGRAVASRYTTFDVENLDLNEAEEEVAVNIFAGVNF